MSFLSVKSSSCAAVVNICGGSCGTGDGPCCMPGGCCGGASWRERFSMCWKIVEYMVVLIRCVRPCEGEDGVSQKSDCWW